MFGFRYVKKLTPVLSLTYCAAFLLAEPVLQPAALAADKAGYSATQGKPATDATRAAHKASCAHLDFADKQDFADAHRGFIAPLPNAGRILDARGRETWNLAPYAFLAPAMSRDFPPSVIMPTPAADTVHPSLWRQSQLVMRDGLYKVTERIYQVRNADLSNMTIIEGKSGIIVVDPLVSAENAAAALKLYYEHRPHKAVTAVIYSHSHVDHFGGVRGIINADDLARGVQVVAPEGFMQAATTENIMAGAAMGRRAQYMYGVLLPPHPTGHVGSGLGLKNSVGSVSVIPPTVTIGKSGQSLTLDGLTFVFLLTPNTEAPAEMHWYIPELKALTTAENCTHTMHNLYTLRGAKTRDPMSWSRALDETLQLWGGKAEVLYSMHHWPVWGKENISRVLTKGRDLYRYINDQTLHLANQGQSMLEIAENLRLPRSLDSDFALRGYYGSLNHNVKGVYNFYLGWFDANPAHLHALPPRAAAQKYVEYMGGARQIISKARKDFAKGEYRWVAQVLDHVIFAQPDNKEARELAADALEQMGYQAESGPWRNFYLSGARDLRGLPPAISPQAAAGANTLALSVPPARYFDYLAVRLNAARAEGKELSLHIVLLDQGQEPAHWQLTLGNSVLNSRGYKDLKGTVHIKGKKQEIMALFEGKMSLDTARSNGLVTGEGKEVAELLSLLDVFSGNFPLVLPAKE